MMEENTNTVFQWLKQVTPTAVLISAAAIFIIAMSGFLRSHKSSGKNLWEKDRECGLTVSKGELLDIMPFGYFLDDSNNELIAGCRHEEGGNPQEEVIVHNIESGKNVAMVKEGQALPFWGDASVSCLDSSKTVICSTYDSLTEYGFYLSCLSSEGEEIWRDKASQGCYAKSCLSGGDIFLAGAYHENVMFDKSNLSFNSKGYSICLVRYNSSGEALSSASVFECTERIYPTNIMSDGKQGIWLTCLFSRDITWNGELYSASRGNLLLTHFTPSFECDITRTIPSGRVFSVCSDQKGGGWIAGFSPVSGTDLLPFQETKEKQIYVAHFTQSGEFDRGRSISGDFRSLAIAQPDEETLYIAGNTYKQISVEEPGISFDAPCDCGFILSLNSTNLAITGRSAFKIDGPLNTLSIAKAKSGGARVFARFWGGAYFASGKVNCKRGIFKTLVFYVEKSPIR